MAVPLIGFGGLILLAIILFLIGLNKTEMNVNVGFAFIVLASIVLFSTSIFVMNEGLQLGSQESIDTTTDLIVINYQTISYDVNSWNWLRVITDIIFYGGFVGLIIGFWKAYSITRDRRVSEWSM